MNNKFRINLHSAFYDPEKLGDGADNTKKDPNEKNRTYEPEDMGLIHKLEKKSKQEEGEELKEIEDKLGIRDSTEVDRNDIDTIVYFDYGTLFDIKEFSEFKFLDGVEKTDERGKYIEINGKKIYHDDCAPEGEMAYKKEGTGPESYLIIGHPDTYVITLNIMSYRSPGYIGEPSPTYRYREDFNYTKKSLDFTNIPKKRDFIIDEKYVEEIMNKS